MLDPNALQQLKQLKQDIEDSKERLTGVIRAGNGRFGFAACGLPDGTSKDVFITPDEMNKVMPGDIVNLLVVKDEKGKDQGLIEGIKHSDFNECFGIYRIKGSNHFVQVDQGKWSRWLFVPPQKRAPKADHGAQEGSYVKANLTRHPYPDGKAQVSIQSNFGNAESAGIEARFTAAKLSLPQQWSDAAIAEADNNIRRDDDGFNREDLTHLAFVTIDAVNTLDMDDAVYAEQNGDAIRLYVAIADPDVYVPFDGELDKQARLRASSIYLPGGGIPMLPPALSQQVCSLTADQQHKALVAVLDISPEGELVSQTFKLAIICSRAKLSYDAVSQLLDGQQSDIEATLQDSLKCINEVAKARHQWRRTHALIGQERPDYAISLDDNKKICAIRKVDRNTAQNMIEECMLTTNLAAAQLLADLGQGIFSIHPGFRPEQINEAKLIIDKYLPELEALDFTDTAHYKTLIDAANSDVTDAPIVSLIQRRLIPGSFSHEAKSHFGLGVKHYATITSPIRRYADLINLRLIKAHLADKTCELPLADIAAQINQQSSLIRQASNNTEHWMKIDWLAQQNIHESVAATIINFRHTAITVRLDDWGIIANVDMRKSKRGYNFQSLEGTANVGDLKLTLDANIPVLIERIDQQNKEVFVKLAL